MTKKTIIFFYLILLAFSELLFGAGDDSKSKSAEYPNLSRDISWIPAESDLQKDYDFSKVAGKVIAHSPMTSGVYLGSPSLVILPDGTYVASHDMFGKNWNEKDGTTILIYQSADKGETWRCVSRVNNQNWSSLFWHNGALYLIGSGYPACGFSVRKSLDKGVTWTEAKDEKSGLIVKNKISSNPMPVLVAGGRIFTTHEGAGASPKPKGWGHNTSFILSAPADSNLLDAAVWTKSNEVIIPNDMATLAHVGWLEGNPVQRKSDGKIFNILRTHGVTDEVAGFYEISPDGKTATLDTYNMFLRIPGACKKFYIVYDEKSDMYYALSNWTMERDRGKVTNCPHQVKAERTRNTLALSRSKNLMDWEMYSIILHDNDIEHSGFQYPSAVIDGNDLLIVSRTALFDGEAKADSQHNSNFITFHRVENFRDRTLDSKPLSGRIK